MFIKVKSVDFLIDGKRKKRDKRKQFKATLVLAGLLPGPAHQLAARALLKTQSRPAGHPPDRPAEVRRSVG